ncbi:MAG: GGDEF domain-containing protein, partial [Bauldia sp.]
MTIDVPTLFVVLSTVCVLVGSVFLFAWARSPAMGLFLRAGAAFLLIAVGVVLILLRDIVPDRLSIDVANALLLLGFGVGWSAARHFEGHSTPIAAVAGGAVLWLCACSFPLFYDDLRYRVALMSLIC